VVADGEAATAAFDALDAAIDTVIGLDSELLCSRERLALLQRCFQTTSGGKAAAR
jgi:hypothetical protein